MDESELKVPQGEDKEKLNTSIPDVESPTKSDQLDSSEIKDDRGSAPSDLTGVDSSQSSTTPSDTKSSETLPQSSAVDMSVAQAQTSGSRGEDKGSGSSSEPAGRSSGSGDDLQKSSGSDYDLQKFSGSGNDLEKSSGSGDDQQKSSGSGDNQQKSSESGDNQWKPAERGDIQQKTAGSGGSQQKSLESGDNLQKTSGSGDDQQKSSGSAGDQQKSTSVEISNTKPEEQSQAGASSETSVPAQGGAGGPGGSDMMAKMMAMMAKGGAPAMPGAPGKPAGAMPDMMAMMGKGGGMPDMMAMMGKGGMPDMMAMMGKGGMPDMMAMMGKGGMPDMMAMMSGGAGGMPDMSKMKPNPLEMAKMFECIIDVSLARSDSDSEDDDSDSVTLEIPCQYCSRYFPSQMTLKTHILVAHEKEDTSVLNITDLIIDSKGKRSVKGHHGLRCKQSKDHDIAAFEAAGSVAKLPEPSAQAKVVVPQEDPAAAEASRGTKRGRRSRKGSEAAETSGAVSVEAVGADSDSGLHSSPRLAAGAVPSSCVTASPPETRKRSSRLRSVGSSSDNSSPQVTTKKIKSGSVQRNKDGSQKEDPSRGRRESSRAAADTAVSGDTEAIVKHKRVKTNTTHSSSAPQGAGARGKKLTLQKDKDTASSDVETSAEPHLGEQTQSKRGGRRSQTSSGTTSTSSSSKGSKSPVATRRSLRSRKSHWFLFLFFYLLYIRFMHVLHSFYECCVVIIDMFQESCQHSGNGQKNKTKQNILFNLLSWQQHNIVRQNACAHMR